MQQQIKILLFTYLLLFKVNESKNFTGETQKSYIFIQRLWDIDSITLSQLDFKQYRVSIKSCTHYKFLYRKNHIR